MKKVYKIYCDGIFSHYEYSKEKAIKARTQLKSFGFVKNYIKALNNV